MKQIIVQVRLIDTDRALGYLRGLRAMIDEAIASRDPRVMRLALQVLRKYATVRRLVATLVATRF